jgi:Protein of unknown function (DUF3117)
MVTEQIPDRPGWGAGTVAALTHDGRAPAEEADMAAMKPRTGDGPMEVTKEGRGLVMRVPLEGGGRLVVELSADEATELGDALKAAVN